MEPLFYESSLQIEKTASEVALPEDPNQWPTELLQELYKQVPYISDFQPDIIMDRVDAEKRYGFGHIEVSNKTEIQDSPASPAAQAAGIRHVRIPIIVREGKLLPFDVIVTDTQKILPLTERRLRQSLFRPQMFDVTSRTPGDQSMISQLYPPYRQNYGFGGGGSVMTAGMGKEGGVKEGQNDIRALTAGSIVPEAKRTDKQDHSPGDIPPVEKSGSILEAILPTINPSDFRRFVGVVAEHDVKVAMHHNRDAVQSALSVLSKYEEPNLELRMNKLSSAIRPTVAQLTCSPGLGYFLKTANHACWQPETVHLDRGEVFRKFGADAAMEADQHGSVTMTEGAQVEGDLPEADQPELISEYGIYKVQDSNGRQLIGFVFPNLLDLDGTALPLALFTNGSDTAMQGEIVGVRVAQGAALIEGPPQGHGMFYKVLPNGKAVATVPLDIQAGLRESGDMDGNNASLMASSPLHGGTQVTVRLQPGLKSVTGDAEGSSMLIPEDWKWLPLDQTNEVELNDKPDQFQKQAHLVGPTSWVELRASDKSNFSVSGVPVEKLAEDERSFMSVDETMFLLAGLGVAPAYGIQKMGEALAHSEPIRIPTSREISPFAHVMEEIREKVAQSPMPDMRQLLVKEAAFVPDPTAVDTVLSLGFINPENVLTFISYLPAIDDAQCKMCELLLASRMGVSDLNDAALERAIRGVEATLEGLRTLAFQSN